MASKKSYSRFFIILQEDEKGHGLSSDKAPSGYTKIEVKNSKCKLSYYVQNLKKSDTNYYMALICDKKDIKNIIKLGKMNIDEHGRADIVCEYDGNNIGNVGVNVESISGAAIITMNGKNMKSIMNGFITCDVSNDWKKYEVIAEQNLVRELNEVKFDEYEKEIENKKIEDEKIENKKDNISTFKLEDLKKSDGKEEIYRDKQIEDSNNNDDLAAKENTDIESNNDELVSKEDIYENIKSGAIDMTEEELEQLLRHKKKNKKKKDYDSSDEDDCEYDEHKKKKHKEKKEKYDDKCDECDGCEKKKHEEKKEKYDDECNGDEKKKDVEKKKKDNYECDECEKEKHKEKKHDECDEYEKMKGKNWEKENFKDEEKIDGMCENKDNEKKCADEGFKQHQNYYEYKEYMDYEEKKKEYEINFKDESEVIENKNTMNKFFKEIVKEFEEVYGYNDIKNCKWYKVKIYQLEDMYCMNDYKKYTVIYYPMICYYPYISKYKHCMIGHKHDKDGNLKYIIYAIPGGKSDEEQPYGGKTGFVTWMPNKENTNYGYWLMFYDFKNSTVVVPVKK